MPDSIALFFTNHARSQAEEESTLAFSSIMPILS